MILSRSVRDNSTFAYSSSSLYELCSLANFSTMYTPMTFSLPFVAQNFPLFAVVLASVQLLGSQHRFRNLVFMWRTCWVWPFYKTSSVVIGALLVWVRVGSLLVWVLRKQICTVVPVNTISISIYLADCSYGYVFHKIFCSHYVLRVHACTIACVIWANWYIVHC